MPRMRWPTSRRSGGRGRMPVKMRLVIALVVAGVSIITFLSTSETNPITGETQRVGLTPDQEIALGMKAAPSLVKQFGGTDNGRDDQLRVKRIGARLVDAAMRLHNSRNPYEFEFTLLADRQTVNAFALPGGRVFITRALYDRLTTDDGLAGVLGHEVGHVVHRHGAEHMAQQQLTQGLVGATAVATDRADAATAAAVIAGLINMKYGRADELECDEFGLIIMTEAGYDPHAMIDVMKVLASAGGGKGPPEWASTHPDPGNRIERIEQIIRKRTLLQKPPGPDLPAESLPPIPPPARTGGPDVATARANRSSGLWITDNAVVTRILADDNDGSRHQRFIVELHDGKTVLVAHNIDLAPRVPVDVGDTIRFHGEYEWNVQGGLVHWTHHDPDPDPGPGSRPGGWIEHKGKTYR